MAKENLVTRRQLLKVSGISALALSASSVLGSRALEMCQVTPRQPEGPFYPISDQDDKNTDLTVVDGKTELALGSLIYLSGKIIDQGCAPVANAVVEIWQACATGKYNHPGDRNNPSVLDTNFQYWGIAVTSASGEYNFKTIKPGHYEAGPGWIRPPHIHFKVHKRGIKELITQMYFEGNQFNEADLILKDIPRGEWGSVVRPMLARGDEAGRKAYDMSFDISVKRLI